MPETLGEKAVRILNEIDAADGKADRRIDISNEQVEHSLAVKTRDAVVLARNTSGPNAKNAAEDMVLRGLIINYLDEHYDDRVVTLASDETIKAAFSKLKLDLRATGDEDSPQQQAINGALQKCIGKPGNSR